MFKTFVPLAFYAHVLQGQRCCPCGTLNVHANAAKPQFNEIDLS